MHMADALLSPAVAAGYWAASGAALAWSCKRLRDDRREYLTPLMGVLGAFVFAAQMLNFALPGVGASGHLGGALLLAILLGAPAAFIVIASILTVQALFFADGGLLALGANLFNIGFIPCFIAWPLIYRPLRRLAGAAASKRRLTAISIIAAVVGLQAGAFSVVASVHLSGVSALPFDAFLLAMQPVHLAIGVVEGLATAAVVAFVLQARPDLDLMAAGASSAAPGERRTRRLAAPAAPAALAAIAVFSLAAAAAAVHLASQQPDGLEWAIEHVAGDVVIDPAPDSLQQRLAQLQQQAPLPDYQLAAAATPQPGSPGASLPGLIGGALTLVAVTLAAFLLRRRRNTAAPQA